MRAARALLAVALLGVLAGCNNEPTEPSIVFPTTVDSFSGTLAVGGTATYRFTTNVPGQVTVTLLRAGPPDGVVVGFGVGLINEQACNITNSLNTPAGPMPQIGGSATPGTYCLSIYDIGNLQQPLTFLIAVAHS